MCLTLIDLEARLRPGPYLINSITRSSVCDGSMSTEFLHNTPADCLTVTAVTVVEVVENGSERGTKVDQRGI